VVAELAGAASATASSAAPVMINAFLMRASEGCVDRIGMTAGPAW
jgi:hypothetical protein